MKITTSGILIQMSLSALLFLVVIGGLKLHADIYVPYANLTPGEPFKLEWITVIFYFSLITLMGLFTMACWSADSMVMTPTSISKRNFFGRKLVIPWEEVTKVQDYTPTYDEVLKSEGKVYVYAGDRAIKIHNTILKGEIADMQKMVAMKTPPNAVVEPETSDIYRMHREYHGETP